ncbi:type I restriction endonuclease subunit R [Thalassotalea sp. G20_0]|uniref:type I restriction endonuclease subunit R n=1 Tax=Thalassotalea sp. G20_0 TaxID=2821093 RepID=UPI001AD96F45|nr:type I restriction endonuclease subunit R [Thalassotalea sp. G20_0]
MVSQTNEQALEAAIEQQLTGTCLEHRDKVAEGVTTAAPNHGYRLGNAQDFNAHYAVDNQQFWAFLQATQGDELAKLQKAGADWQQKILDRYDRLVKKYGLLHLLKKGLDVDNAHLTLFYPAPLASSSEKVKARFAANIFSTTRQVHYSLANRREAIGQVLFINGLPFATLELKAALEQGKKIIITTIQKFPFIIDGISDLSNNRFAVIIDEAHSSQSGSAHDNMNRAIGTVGNEEDEALDAQDKILKAMRSRKMRGNASYFAFTATPKSTTLEKFCTRQQDGSFHPFHLYSMKQAIEEGFILDVLANYTTYKSYYEIQKSIQDNPLFDTRKAQKKLKAFVERHQQTINLNAEIMLDHFMEQVVGNKNKLKGKAKGMVITQNIESAIRYYHALTRLLADRGQPFKVLIAFSGSKAVDGIEYSEPEVNGFSESDTRDRFDTDDYRLLVVANKYLTGFDQPKLCTMYVDKKLQGVLAVQALSRLNRAAPKLNKKTEDLFILDFFNEVEDIKAAFDPFYTATSLSQATDVNVLHELKAVLDEVGVYEWAEVEQFVEWYFGNADAQQLSPRQKHDHILINPSTFII